jgi:formylglycine-generating enzyme required for sulfatase activity
MTNNLPLRVFLSSVPEDRENLYRVHKLHFSESWIDCWDDNFEGIDAKRIPDAILVCLSKNSITEEGFLKREIGYAMDIVDEYSERAILVLVVRLEDCLIPGRLRRWQSVDYFNPGGLRELIGILRKFYENEERIRPITLSSLDEHDPDLFRFVRVEFNRKSSLPYVFWIAKYPVTNAQYERFLLADDFGKEDFWQDFFWYDSACKYQGQLVKDGVDFLQSERLTRPSSQGATALLPRFWQDAHFGATQRNNPVVGISWFEANAYTKWLSFHWSELLESQVNSNLHQQVLRLPLKTEWEFAARGDSNDRSLWRFPLDLGAGTIQQEIREGTQRANVKESHIWCTTPVDTYPEGASPFGVMDMFGNVWEWLANESPEDENLPPFLMAVRGGSWKYNYTYASLSDQVCVPKTRAESDLGFRLIAIPVVE